MTDDIKTQNLRLVNRQYCVKSDPIMLNHRDLVKTPLVWLHGSVKTSEMLGKKTFSCEIQNNDMYPTCQNMTLLGKN